MKTLTGISSLSVMLLLLAFSVDAQQLHYRDQQDPGKGHWQLFTNATTQATSVKFYDANKQLIYEEVIPDRFIKLTDRNISKINRAFDQVVDRKLIMAQVKFTPLTSADYRRLESRKSLERRNNEAKSAVYPMESVSPIQAHVYRKGDKGKFSITILNPGHEQMSVYLFNKINQHIYSEKVDKASYRRDFNFEGMPEGTYKVVVTTADKRYHYTKQIEIKPFTQTREVPQPDSTFLLSTRSAY